MSSLPRAAWGRALWGLSAAVLALGFAALVWHATVHRQRALETWQGRLEAMAEDRQATVDYWLGAGLDNARTIAAYPTARHVLKGAGPRTLPAEVGAREHLDRLLDQAVSGWQYTAGAIADTSGGLVTVQGSRLDGLRDKVATASEGVHILGSASAPAYVLFVAAVKAADEEEPLGVVVLAADPERFLFPLLRREPVGSATGETLVALHEGDEVVFLSTPRFHPGGPLSLRRPIDSPRFAMRHALAGDGAFGEFLDYRAVPVIASTRRVSAAPWGLVVKVDAAEVYALERRRLLLECAVLLFVLAALAGLAYAVRRQEKGALTAALDRAGAHLAAVLDHANDAVLLVSPDGRIEDANRRAAELYGVPKEKLLGRSVLDTRSVDEHPLAAAELQRVVSEGSLLCEAVHFDVGGTPRRVEVSSRLVDLGEGPKVVSIVRDVGVRKQHEGRILSLSRLYQTLSEVNRRIVRASDRQALFEDVPRVLAGVGGFPLAFVGSKGGDGSLEVVARDGSAAAYARGLEIRWDATPLGRGPEGSALREGRPFVVPDVATEPSFAPWADRAAHHGVRTVGAFPVRIDGETAAVIAVYGSEAGTIGEEEEGLLQALAGDLGLALTRLQAEREQERTNAALEAFFRNDVVGLFFGDADGQVVEANDAYLRIVGYSREELARGGVRRQDITPAEHLAKDGAAIAEAREKGACTPYEKEYLRKDGRRVWVLVGFTLVEPERERSVGFVYDLTARKEAEEEIEGLHAELEALARRGVPKREDNH